MLWERATRPWMLPLTTDTSSLEDRLADAERRLDLLMENCVDGMVIIDDSGVIRAFNPAAETIFGFSSEEVIGANVSVLMPEPDRSSHDDYVRNYVESRTPRIIGIGREVLGRRKDGSTFPMDLSVGDMSGGSATSFIGVIRDLTEQRTIEQQLLQASKMEAVGQLTGGIAHDFNNILAILMMDLEMLKDEVADRPEAADLVTEALKVTRTGADLTQRLLAFSRRQSLVPSRLDVNELVQSLTGLLRRTLGEAIRVDTAVPPDLWPISVDRGQLENALVNLCINARDAMPGGGQLTIECDQLTIRPHDLGAFQDLMPGDYVRISISDTGAGMPADVANRAFEPFFTTKGGGHGTGLGLSMVYGFTKQSGGHATIYSEEGVGTSVHLYYPRDADPEAEQGEVEEKGDIATGNESILLVEDDDRLRSRTSRTLQNLGYDVVTAVNGQAALDILDGGYVPDLVLTDVIMPGAPNGAELAGLILKEQPDQKILFMTGYAENAAALADIVAEGNAILNKPFTRNELAASIRRRIDRKRS